MEESGDRAIGSSGEVKSFDRLLAGWENRVLSTPRLRQGFTHPLLRTVQTLHPSAATDGTDFTRWPDHPMTRFPYV